MTQQLSLHKAAAVGNMVETWQLLTRGENINQEDRKGWTALHHAIDNGQGEVARLLLSKGARVNVVNPVGEYTAPTPLELAVKKADAALVRELLDRGADVNARHGAALRAAVEKGDMELVTLLIDNGAKVDLPSADTRSAPIYFAVKARNRDMTEHLLLHGANPNTLNRADGSTPLHLAADDSSYTMARLLLKHSAEPNARDRKGNTPLHIAAERGCTELIDLLLEHHADPAIQNRGGKTPLDIAVDTDTVLRLRDSRLSSQGWWRKAFGRLLGKRPAQTPGSASAEENRMI